MAAIIMLSLFQLVEAEKGKQTLLKNRSKLEHDTEIKAKSLFIDKEECMFMRKDLQLVRFDGIPHLEM